VNREDVEITFSDSVLSVSGERRSEVDEEEVSFYVRERYYGTFRRSMTLLASIDESSAPTSRTVCWRSPFRGAAVAAAEP
jgi:HSP20 family molecular chaperone IbpA